MLTSVHMANQGDTGTANGLYDTNLSVTLLAISIFCIALDSGSVLCCCGFGLALTQCYARFCRLFCTFLVRLFHPSILLSPQSFHL